MLIIGSNICSLSKCRVCGQTQYSCFIRYRVNQPSKLRKIAGYWYPWRINLCKKSSKIINMLRKIVLIYNGAWIRENSWQNPVPYLSLSYRHLLNTDIVLKYLNTYIFIIEIFLNIFIMYTWKNTAKNYDSTNLFFYINNYT